MLLISLLGWWYGSGWAWLAGRFAKKLVNLQETFSVPILLKTLFSPWKQIQTPSTFQNFFQAMIDNLISRLIGGIVRTCMLIAAFFLTILIFLFAAMSFLVWPLLPPLILILPLMSLSGVELW